VHGWTLRTMINAAEEAIEQSAADESERARNRAKLYAPPRPARRAGGRRPRPPRVPVKAIDAEAMMAQLAAEDARVSGMRTS